MIESNIESVEFCKLVKIYYLYMLLISLRVLFYMRVVSLAPIGSRRMAEDTHFPSPTSAVLHVLLRPQGCIRTPRASFLPRPLQQI